MSVAVMPRNLPAAAAGSFPDPLHSAPSIVIVGNGPVGFRLLQDLVSRQLHRRLQVTVFGEERGLAYDRPGLTRMLTEDVSESLVYQPLSWYEQHGIRMITGDPVIGIDRSRRIVCSRSNRLVTYDQLILATGSRSVIPALAGFDLEGVFPCRTLDDLNAIRIYSRRCRSVAVLGGGPLGLEAAHGLAARGLNVYVVEKGPVLMPRQLDNAAAELLRRKVVSERLQCLLQRQPERISRISEGLHLELTSGESLIVDMVVVAAGVRPRDELARACQLPTGRRGGVLVDDQLRTSDPAICAIGECAEHQGIVYGRPEPGFRMAEVVAEQLRGQSTEFSGFGTAMQVKIGEVEIRVAGDSLNLKGHTTLVHETTSSYTKLILEGNRVTGLMGVGPLPEFDELQEALLQNRRLKWWHKRRFETSGRL
ncbi:MAG: FAD-dependent oxidoreductase [Planctomycetaceae bacterium]